MKNPIMFPSPWAHKFLNILVISLLFIFRASRLVISVRLVHRVQKKTSSDKKNLEN